MMASLRNVVLSVPRIAGVGGIPEALRYRARQADSFAFRFIGVPIWL